MIKQQYELIDIDKGVNVYCNKENHNLLLCPNCFNIHKKESILQSEPTSEYKVSKKYHCKNCYSYFKLESKSNLNKPNKVTKTGPWG